MEPKWGLWQHTRFLRTKMWASNVGGGACLASFAISQQPLPWPTASPPPPAGTAKRIRIKRETCFSLASCSGPMTSPLQPPAPRFQPPSTFFPFCRRPSILFEFHHFIHISKQLFKMFSYIFICVSADMLPSTPLGFSIGPFKKKTNKANSNQRFTVWMNQT